MTETLIITAYPYRELSDTAMDTAKHNVGDHWYEQEREDTKCMAENLLNEKGITLQLVGQETLIDVSFCQGSGMSIKGRWDLSDFDECEPIVDIATDFPQFDRQWVTAEVKSLDNHYVHAGTMRIELEYVGDTICHDLTDIDVTEMEYDDYQRLVELPLDEMAERLTEVLRTICNEIHRKLENFILGDCDGYIEQWMDDMGYLFDEDGHIVKEGD